MPLAVEQEKGQRLKGQSEGFMSSSTAKVIHGQTLIAICQS